MLIEKNEFRFNGKYKDNEIAGTGNSLDFGARMYNPRLGRWLSLDALAKKYPFASPYSFCLNSPLKFVDPDGRQVRISILTTSTNTGGTIANPTSLGQVAKTLTSANLTYNEAHNEYDLVVQIQRNVSSAVGRIEEQNPGFTNFMDVHETVHQERAIRAARFVHSNFTSPLLPNRAYRGTVDKIATDAITDYYRERNDSRNSIRGLVEAEFKAKGNSDVSAIAKTVDERQNAFDVETTKGAVLHLYEQKRDELQSHEGPSGVSTEAAGKLTGAAKEMQEGTKEVKLDNTNLTQGGGD